MTSTRHLPDSPGNWKESSVTALLDVASSSLSSSLAEMNIRGRVIRKKRAVGLIPLPGSTIPRESLDECVLRVQSALHQGSESFEGLPYCAFNGGRDAWVDVGNKRVGVSVLQAYLGLPAAECLHVGDQFLNTGNDYAARGCSPCAWITSPDETGYILRKILKYAGDIDVDPRPAEGDGRGGHKKVPSLEDMTRRSSLDATDPSVTADVATTPRSKEPGKVRMVVDVYTGEMLQAGVGSEKKKQKT